jgi:DNA-binding beta-propeller fold protein YncE
MRKHLIFVFGLVAVGGVVLYSQRPRPQTVGPDPNGGFLLNTGWRIRPAGTEIKLSTLPMSSAMAPDGRIMAALNGGYLPASVDLLDMETVRKVSGAPITDGWRGLAFSPDGSKLYAGGGARGHIVELSVTGNQLAVSRRIELYPGEKPGTAHLIGDIVYQNGVILVEDTALDNVVVVDPAGAAPLRTIHTVRNPYAMLPASDGKSIFVSSWSTSQIVQYNVAAGAQMQRIDVGPHPTEMIWLPAVKEGGRPRLAIACANSNYVYILGSDREGDDWKVLEKLNLALTPRQPVGMTPSSLALSPDRHTLYVACSDANAIAVADISGETAHMLGFIPTGWYPTTVRTLRDGRIVVFNGKGSGSHPNPDGPNPFKWPIPAGTVKQEYVAGIQTGSASVITPFTAEQLSAYTRTVMENSPYRDSLLDDAQIAAGNPIPSVAGGATPIQHVILLMKENRTYDQVLGDMKEGNGDPNLVLFGEKITPNHHKLAREFVLLDNFYVNADVSADGYYWTTAAIAPDSNQRTWPMSYARRVYGRGTPGPEGTRSAPGGHIWDRAAEAGVSFYNYGFTAVNLPKPPEVGVQIREVQDSVLRPHTNMKFRQHDRSFSDIIRMRVFQDDLAQWEKSGQMPQLVLMTIGNDHTEGTRPGIRAPISCVADNDQALGIMAEAISRSKFWSSTAMFVVEDDAQDGADHVDSHRTIAYVISPYTRRGIVDSTLYNTTSILRSIELILGLKPMTMFDAAARPMANAFSATGDFRPYVNEAARVPLNDKNPQHSATAERSEKLDFSQSDLADEDELNDILWLAIKGTPPPAPVRSAFAR